MDNCTKNGELMKNYSEKYFDNDIHFWPVLSKSNNYGIKPCQVGHQQCGIGHEYDGDVIKTIVHYVDSGKGIFKKNGKVYEVTPGQAFVINKDEKYYYCSSPENPWHYYWLIFEPGVFAEKFKQLSPVVDIKDSSVFTNVIKRVEAGTLTDIYVTAQILLLCDQLFGGQNVVADYAVQVSNYINFNYMRKIKVEDMAQILGLDRRYLSKYFKKKYGISIKQYIVDLRFKKAKEFLKKGKNVKETANLVGYNDPYAFSKMFKNIYGISPSEITVENK